jgi:hypothetical protein
LGKFPAWLHCSSRPRQRKAEEVDRRKWRHLGSTTRIGKSSHGLTNAIRMVGNEYVRDLYLLAE